MASRLVLGHKAPYLDFLWPQAPLLPYAYALWIKLFGISWFSARSLSATLTALVGLLIYEHVCRTTQNWIVGVISVTIFASSTLIFAWFPLAKTYSLTALFLFGTYAIVTRLSPASTWLVAVAGLLFGLSVDIRLYVVGVAPILLWWLFRHPEPRYEISRILWFLVGFAVGVVPCLYFFFSSPDLFLFNNFWYHAIRSDSSLIGNWRNKLHIALTVLFRAENNSDQFSILSTLSVLTILASRVPRDATLLAFLIALVLGFISILPTPSYSQYFCLCMPFLIVSAVCGASDYVVGAPRPKWAAVAASLVVLAFIASSGPSFRRYLITGDNVIGIKDTSDAPNWTLDRVSAVSRAIDQLAAPREEIASFWPGYIFASKADPYPGFENHSGWDVTNRLTVDQRMKYRILAENNIVDDFRSHIPRIVIVGNQWYFSTSDWASVLLMNGYTAAITIGDASLFVCCSR